MKKLISEKVILLLIGIGIWALVLQNAGIIPTDKGVYVNGGNVSVSGNVNIVTLYQEKTEMEMCLEMTLV